MNENPYSFDASSPARRWGARWIWAEGDGHAKNAYYYFRKPFTLEHEPGEARLFISADTRYLLFVNGSLVGRGVPQSKPYFQYYDEHAVGALLQQGENCIAIIAYHLGTLTDTRGGLLAELVDEHGLALAATDASWRVAPADAWSRDTHCAPGNQMTPFQEFFDARRVPEGWDAIGFDDSAWAQATVFDTPPARFSCPFTRLVPRDIPTMRETPMRPVGIQRVEESTDLAARKHMNDLSIGLSQVGGPLVHTRVENLDAMCGGDGVAVVQGSTDHIGQTYCAARYSPAVVLDFGRVVTAFTELELDAGAGTVVEMGYAERLVDGYVNIALECPFADRYTTRDGHQRYRTFSWRAFRYLKIRFRNCDAPATLHAIRAIETTYPYEDRGGFQASDETLNAVFKISRNTVRLCSNECLMDTPYREQAQWLGDVAAVTLPAIYACFGDTMLPEKFLRQAAGNQLPTGLFSSISNSISHGWNYVIPDYSLWWVIALWKHYQYTGDERWIHQYYPTAQKVINAIMPYLNSRGLVEDMPYWVFIDWAPLDRRGECTAFNAIFYGALEALQNMATLKKDQYTENLTRSTRTHIKDAFQNRLFDPERGCFADARIHDEWSEVTSEQANYAAILWNLCDEATAKAIIDRLLGQPALTGVVEAQPFFMCVVLEALNRTGRIDLALRLVRDRWGKRMVDRGATSTYEEWSCDGSWRSGEFVGFQRTHSHAWSACPASFLIENLIRLEILEPGCGKVSLDPAVTGFDYEVAYPTPRGTIRVRCKDGVLSVESPEAIEVVQKTSGQQIAEA